ncbi:hypothetical protein PtA15_15A40 [Puccinia triticina]|uniref:Uncharacterized protein n=1 Tax=Puccinia triticina TaxID=208348 RepID=A0ABY7D2M0_9BASI|nr:uncharacterized protein PtA15_15A40 [Puccinia triticina]WAQ91651.1 hypothetical protein PtA15_15A40 [Puccinia triticina]WAR62450.1 hypothetical protein PtB15_15B34 [Puccinia triticina]
MLRWPPQSHDSASLSLTQLVSQAARCQITGHLLRPSQKGETTRRGIILTDLGQDASHIVATAL